MLKWAGLILLVLVVIGVAGSEGWRLHNANKYHDEMMTEMARLEEMILKGMTPTEFIESRVSGENGDKYILEMWTLYSELAIDEAAFIEESDDAGEALLEWSRRWFKAENAGAGLADFANALWGEDARMSDAPLPSHEVLQKWLEASERYRELVKLAGNSDYLLEMPHDLTQRFSLLPTSPKFLMNVLKVIPGRIRAHAHLGSDTEARTELLAAAKMANRFVPAANLFVHSYMLLLWGDCEAVALEMAERGMLDSETREEFARLTPDFKQAMVDAVEGNLAFVYGKIRETAWINDEPSLFDWVGAVDERFMGETNRLDDLDDLRRAFIGRIVHAVHASEGLRSGLDGLELVRAGEPLEKTLDVGEGSDILHGVNWIDCVTDCLAAEADNERYRLAYELRAIEHEHGPLAGQKERVAELARGYSKVILTWDGDDLLLVVPNYEQDDVDYHDPETSDDDNALRLAPLSIRNG